MNIDGQVFKAIWRLGVHERARMFVWQALRGEVLTNAERKRRHLSGSDECAHCPGQAETLLHIFRDCVKSRALWLRFKSPAVDADFMKADFAPWFRANLLENRFGLRGWPNYFATMIWHLWKWKNDWIFNRKNFDGNKVCFVKKQVKDYKKAWASSYNLLELPKKQVNICWTPPPPFWIKLNTDGSVVDGRATAAGVCRDHEGAWMGGFVHNVGLCSVPMAELWGIVSGLQFAWDQGFRRVCLETNSNLAIQLLDKPVEQGHPLSSLVVMARSFLRRDWDIQFCHVYREANRVADDLASFAFSFLLGVFSLGVAPDRVIPLLSDDVSGKSFVRLVPL